MQTIRLILSFLSILVMQQGFGACITVCPTCGQRSVKEAIAKARSGDTVLVKAGTYREYGIHIDKSLVLRGENHPVLDAMGQGEVIRIHADRVTVEGIEIRNTGMSHIEDRAAIRIKRSRHFTIRNNRLKNNFFGIYLEHSREGVIQGNHLQSIPREEANSGNGIHLWYCKQVNVANNRIKGHRDGIYLEFADSCLITRNLSEGNLRYGLHFMFSNDDDYFHNTFRDNGAGVAVMFSRRIDMWENTFALNWGQASYGLLLKEIYDAEIRDNTFRENTIGIFVEGSNRVHYKRNTFRKNGWAIKMAGGCLDNRVEGNNFLSNTFDLAMHSGSNNTFNGNYWSAYEGYDLDRDGIGDVPYRPVKLFNYVVHQTPEAMILLRSLFVDLLHFAEKVSPVFTPKDVADNRPLLRALTLPYSPEIH